MGSFFVSLRLPLDKISCTRQFESKLSLRSFAKSLAKRRVFRKPTRPSLPLRKAPPPHQASLPSETRGCNRPTRCSEPLRSKVGGPSKVFAMVVRDGTALIRCFLCLILRHILYESKESKD